MPKFALVAAAALCPALPAFANAGSVEFRAEPRSWAPRPEVFTGRQSVPTPVTPLLRRGESGSAGGHRTLPAQDDLRACRRPARATIELQLREPAPRAAEATERELLRRYIDVWDRDDADFLNVIDRLVELIPRVTREVIEGAAYVPPMTTPERYVEVTTRRSAAARGSLIRGPLGFRRSTTPRHSPPCLRGVTTLVSPALPDIAT